MNIYVGNLSYETTEEDLREAFSPFGQVDSISIIKDKFTGKSKGFGFVEMSDKTEAQAAIDNLNGKELKGRTLNVNEARPREEGNRRGGGGGHYGGGGGGRGGRSGGNRAGGSRGIGNRGGGGGNRGGGGGRGGGNRGDRGHRF